MHGSAPMVYMVTDSVGTFLCPGVTLELSRIQLGGSREGKIAVETDCASDLRNK